VTSPGDPSASADSSHCSKDVDSKAVNTVARFNIRPYWQAYFRRYHEKPNGVLCSRMSKVLAQLEREYAPADVLARFRRYLDRTSPEWFSVPHFAQSWIAWAPPADGPVFTPYHPVSKTVAVQDGKRERLIQVPVDDPRPAA